MKNIESPSLTEKQSIINFYSDNQFSIVPLHTIYDGQCTCAKGINCESAGKHPVTWNGFKDAGKDYKIFTNLNRIHNIGLVTGEINNLVVVDIDPKNGGDVTFNNIISKSPHFIPTLTVLTGEYNGVRGQHFYYRLPDGVEISSKISKNRGVDIKAKGGYIVGPGSEHKSGVKYEIDPNGIQTIEKMSIEFYNYLLIEIFNTPATSSDTPNKNIPKSNTVNFFNERINEGSRNGSLFSSACSLFSRKLKKHEVNAIIKSINLTHCVPPLSDEEVETILNGAAKYEGDLIGTPDWSYNFFDGPLADVSKEVTLGTEVAPVSVYVILIVLLGSYIGLKAKFKYVASNLQTNLYLILIGLTKSGKKGAAQAIAERVFKIALDEADDWHKCTKRGVKTAEAIVSLITDEQFASEKNTKTNSYENILVCEKVIDKRLNIIESEFNRLLKEAARPGSIMSEVLRQGYDGGALSTTTKTNSRSTDSSHITVLGHITPTEFQDVRRKVDDLNGFANRFLHIYSNGGESPIAFPRNFDQWDMQIINKLKPIVNWINEHDEIVMTLSPSSHTFWEQYYIKHFYTKKSDMIDSLTARNEIHVMKISMIMAIADCSSVIQPEHIQRAISLIEFNSQTIEYIYQSDEETEDNNVSKICTFLYNNGGTAKRSDITKKCFQKNKSSDDVNELMAICIQKGRIEVSQSGKTEIWSLKARTTYDPEK